MKYFQHLITSGYGLIILLIGCIIYTWHHEWQDVEHLGEDNRLIDRIISKINDVYIRLIEFSLLGETILDWDDEDLEHYHIQRIGDRQHAMPFQNNLSERAD